ncbi:MAG TPA: glucan biosynthesis protein G [Opitutaceae bacterium]|nr:glucan biosynthesis protein G [Opitutaceae bacterium]
MKPAALLALAALALAAHRARADEFSFEQLTARAKALASQPYAPRPSPVPTDLRKLTYDQYRDIRFRPSASWWRQDRLPFELQFFHPGFIFSSTVQISELDGRNAHPIPFSPTLFDYGHNHLAVPPESMGFAGFRILYPLNKPGDELGAFQGASYFRFVCQKAIYGLSARGIAVNSGLPKEEFPDFTAFWIQRPAADAKVLVAYALLDGPSLSGAYRFSIAPGAETVVEVHEVLFCRTNPEALGIAPLTSMFWHGQSAEELHDFRPEVHDSDGLMLHTGRDEWLWRPLSNPPATRIASFIDQRPQGFGLLQRERRYDHYQDIEAGYQLRVSAWVEPVGDWGKGSVRLVELPSPDETNDNIVAYWTPAELPPPGQPLDFRYRLTWFLDQIHPPGAWVVATRHGRSRTQEPDLERFIVDFDGPNLRKLASSAVIEPVVTAGPGAQLVHSYVQHNPYDGTWRVAFALRPDKSGKPVELRCYLKEGGRALSETWSYLWQP